MGQSKGKLRILIVDDHASMRRIIKTFLKDDGYQRFFEAENGLEAIKIIDSQSIDLIISDLLMPVMDGLELLKIVKTGMATAHIPFIMVTVEAVQSTMIKAIEMKVDSYIVKPFAANHLLDEIHRVMA